MYIYFKVHIYECYYKCGAKQIVPIAKSQGMSMAKVVPTESVESETDNKMIRTWKIMGDTTTVDVQQMSRKETEYIKL